MIPIDVLIRPVTEEDIYEKTLDVLETVEIPARSWKPGGVALTIIEKLSFLAAIACSVITFLVRTFFLIYAEKDGLTAHALDVYGVERLPATFAVGPATLINKGGAPFTRGTRETIAYSSNTGARFYVIGTLDEDDNVTPGYTLSGGSEASPTTLRVQVQAIDAGAASTVAPAELDSFETQLGPRVSIINESSIIGRDEETDDQLRYRCSVKKGTWSSFGPRDAYEYAALTAKLTDGTPTNISRVWVSPFSSIGRVDVVCATPSGTPSSDELVAVRGEIERTARPDCVTVVVAGAVQKVVTFPMTLWSRGGAESVIRTNSKTALTKLFATYPIGGIKKTDGGSGHLYVDKVKSALISSSPDVFDVDIDDPEDIELAWNEVAVNATTDSDMTVRIR